MLLGKKTKPFFMPSKAFTREHGKGITADSTPYRLAYPQVRVLAKSAYPVVTIDFDQVVSSQQEYHTCRLDGFGIVRGIAFASKDLDDSWSFVITTTPSFERATHKQSLFATAIFKPLSRHSLRQQPRGTPMITTKQQTTRRKGPTSVPRYLQSDSMLPSP